MENSKANTVASVYSSLWRKPKTKQFPPSPPKNYNKTTTTPKQSHNWSNKIVKQTVCGLRSLISCMVFVEVKHHVSVNGFLFIFLLHINLRERRILQSNMPIPPASKTKKREEKKGEEINKEAIETV